MLLFLPTSTYCNSSNIDDVNDDDNDDVNDDDNDDVNEDADIADASIPTYIYLLQLL